MSTERAIVGHDKQRSQLQSDLSLGKLAHAYLFSGKKHLGKFTVAKWFAGEILTEGKDPVMKSQAQKLMKRNLHPDLLILDQLWIADVCTDWNIIARSSNVSQEERAKKKVRTNTIGIDDVRELQRRLHETAEKGKLCCLIRSIERLQDEAANALLKILEEPPPHVLFCCTTESSSSLPSTILSRMRVLEFFPLPQKELLPFLTSFSEEDRTLLLMIAQGAPGVIFRCMEDPDALRNIRQLHIDAHRFLEGNSRVSRFQQLNAVLDEEQERVFLSHLFLHIEEDFRSSDSSTVKRALCLSRELFSFLRRLQSNPSHPLLAAHLALHASAHSR